MNSSLLGVSAWRGCIALLAAFAVSSCAPGEETEADTSGSSAPSASEDLPQSSGALARLLADGQAVFGIFSNGDTHEAGLEMGANPEPDFVFYSLERGPFDLDTMQGYMEGLAAGGAEAGRQPFSLRIPPVGDSAALAAERIEMALARGVDAIVVPHLHSGQQAAAVVDAMGLELWPGNPQGTLVNMLIVEDLAGMAVVDEVIGTEGVSVVFAGPGDLRRAYEGDMEAVENAIQTVLASCKAHDVPCGVTAGVDDITTRIEQGFRVIIVTAPEAIAIGKSAAGRD